MKSEICSHEEVLGAGKFLRLVRIEGYEFTQRVHCTGVVAVIPITDDNRVILLKQYRKRLKREMIDFPSGLVGDTTQDATENAIDAAKRELIEEAGYMSGNIVSLFERHSSGGVTDETVQFFLAQNLELVSSEVGVDDEVIEVHSVLLSEVDSWLEERVSDGCLVDPKVDVGLRYLDRHTHPISLPAEKGRVSV